MKTIPALIVALAIVVPAPSAFSQTVTPTSTAIVGAQRQHGRWAQDYAGRPADPDIRFGQLPNGMRYAIKRNDTPKNAVSMRMIVGSGSLAERNDERGVAHYLEHMAFRGSANIADGDVVHILERQGLTFGADTNAGTSFNATVYQFDFPKADATALDTGMTLFREIGGRLKIDPAAVDAERGVILSEERLRASANQEAAEAQLALTLAGTGVAERVPIGTIDSIKATTAGKIRRFYEANYRPENATIVIVGAVDPVAVEAQLKQRFSDWHGVGSGETLIVRAPRIGPIAEKSFTVPGVSESLTLTWTRPLDLRADTVVREREGFIRLIGLVALNLRLRERAQAADAPFSAAAVQSNHALGTAEVTTLNIVPTPGRWREALTGALVEQRRLVRQGISAADIARAMALLRPGFQASADGAATRSNPAIANAIVGAVTDDEVVTNPAQDLATVDRIAGTVTPENATTAFRDAFAGSGPLAFRSSSNATSGDDKALAAALATARDVTLAAGGQESVVAWPYSSFGTPGHVIARTTDEVGVTIVTFANGTRLAVKPTKFIAGGVSVQVSFGRGIVSLKPEQAHSRWLAAFGGPAWLQGGTNKLTWGAMQRALEGHNAGLSLAIGDTNFAIGGDTRTNELPFETQLLAAYFADSAYRPDGVTRVTGQVQGQLAAIDSNPQTVLARVLGPLTHNGDPRWKALPDVGDVAATTPADLAPLIRPATTTPADVIMVGDLTVDQAIAAVTPTFGALPSAISPRSELFKDHVAAVGPSASPFVFHHNGRADQAVAVQLWATTDYYAAPADSYALEVARALLAGRLIETVREKLGLTYSPFVAVTNDLDLPGEGYLLAGIEVPSEKFGEFRQVLAEELTAMATKPIDADAFARAKAPIIEAHKKARETNGYWAGRIERVLRDPRASIVYRDEISGIERITPGDVQRVLKLYVVGKPVLSVEVRPASGAK
ncbi:insulinase family protein [Sphingomonas sp. RT2P30]|uniref:M16 family metallopeptidase n=1 Tax=Parasphingomonas halimpatiens TaxID=3096162 RepID=UPI002FC98FE0